MGRPLHPLLSYPAQTLTSPRTPYCRTSGRGLWPVLFCRQCHNFASLMLLTTTYFFFFFNTEGLPWLVCGISFPAPNAPKGPAHSSGWCEGSSALSTPTPDHHSFSGPTSHVRLILSYIVTALWPLRASRFEAARPPFPPFDPHSIPPTPSSPISSSLISTLAPHQSRQPVGCRPSPQ